MSVPYSFSANSSNNTSSGSRPVQYPRLQQQQQQQQRRPQIANIMPSNSSPRPSPQQRGYYAQSPSNSPSTTSLLPPSARAPQTVQATFAKGPTSSLRSMPSTSDLVRSRFIYLSASIETVLMTNLL